MPELPELEVVCEVLRRRVVGETILDACVIPPGGPIVVRDLTGSGFEAGVKGARITRIARRGKFLVFSLERNAAPLFLVINPKLTGRLKLAAAGEKRRAKTHLAFCFNGGRELRYIDQKQMGQVYLAVDPEQAPDFAGMGPEPFEISLEEFRLRLKPFRGEIKGVLTRSDFIAGIGNAYADEILWAARIHPYRKRTQLTADQVNQLYEAMQTTLRDAVEHVRAEMGEAIDTKPRDFLAVHMKSGQPCPRCGTPIALVGANQRITNFCRTCQPGGLIKGM